MAEDLSEFFDPDDFDDCHEVIYEPVDDLIVPSAKLSLTERSGVLEDGTVRSTYYEVIINRQEVPVSKVGDTFNKVSDVFSQYKVTQITSMDNDFIFCEAEKV